MGIYHPIPSPILHLFRLTLQRKNRQSNVYSMGESVDDAFTRYIARVVRLKENTDGIEFVEGDLADPHTHLHRAR